MSQQVPEQVTVTLPDGTRKAVARGTRIVDKRSNLLRVGNVLDEAALDKYSFTRDAYLQRRRAEIYDRGDDREAPPPLLGQVAAGRVLARGLQRDEPVAKRPAAARCARTGDVALEIGAGVFAGCAQGRGAAGHRWGARLAAGPGLALGRLPGGRPRRAGPAS